MVGADESTELLRSLTFNIIHRYIMFSTYFAIYILADVSLTYKMSKFGAFKTISFFSSVQINLL